MIQQPNSKIKNSSLTVGSFFLRFFLWLFTTIVILLIGAGGYFYITFNGPSKLAAENMAVSLKKDKYLYFIPDLYSYKSSDNIIEEATNE